jgi:Na+/H+ antiporter NhaC
MGRDFGPMFRAEKRARETGEVIANEQEIEELKDSEHQVYMGTKSRWFNGLVPILIILFGTMAGLYFTGVESLKSSGIEEYGVQEIISYSDSYSALLWSSFIATLVAVIMSISQRIISLDEIMAGWTKGLQSMMVAVIILVFAWGISSVTNEMKTADYLISIISDSMNPRFLPVLVFIICALTGFSTGTSWGTMAIVMPIVIPLAHKLSLSAELSAPDYWIIMYGVISSVLAGSVFGDHCSPIADTTILSSLASKCNHIDHVNTQLPYAIIVSLVCIVLGYIPAGFGINPFLLIALIVVALVAVLLLLGKELPYSETN